MTNVTPEQVNAVLESLVSQNPNDVINPIAAVVARSDKFMSIIKMAAMLSMKAVLDNVHQTKNIAQAAEAFERMESEIVNGIANLACVMLETGYRTAASQTEVGELERWLKIPEVTN